MNTSLIHFFEGIYKNIVKIPIISPNNKVKFVWDFLVMLTTLCHFFIIVFVFTFQAHDFNKIYEHWLSTLIILIPIDVLFKVNSGFFEKGSAIEDRRQILRKYCRTDLPYDLICFVTLIVNLHVKHLNLIQILYVVKIPIFHNLLENFEEIINFDEKIEAFIALLEHFIKMLFFAHLVACLWFYIGSSTDDDESSWLIAKGYTEKPIFFQYIVSLYWAITTITTTGYGDITAQNEAEFAFCLSVMIMGSIFFGYSLTYIGKVFDKLQKDQRMKK